ncbi:MAG: DNA repair protein RadA, partial [Oxalobacteraceae bacterium]
MAKAKTNYTCSECGAIATRWMGQCADCKAWNTMVETVVEAPGVNRMSQTPHRALAQTAPVLSLADIEAIDVPRFGTGIEEFDRVLGGGLVAGGVVLIGGDPGIGKSTLLLQALASLSKTRSTLYVSGEESGAQIALRARR